MELDMVKLGQQTLCNLTVLSGTKDGLCRLRSIQNGQPAQAGAYQMFCINALSHVSCAKLAGPRADTQLNECHVMMQTDLCAHMMAEKGMHHRHKIYKISQAWQRAQSCQVECAPASDESINVNMRQLPVKFHHPVSNRCSVRQELLQQHRLDPASPAFKPW